MEPVEPIVIPPEGLSPEALAGLVEAFVMREGTDYGEREWTLAEKCEQVHGQLRRGQVLIVFDPASESCTLIPREDLGRAFPGA